MSQEIKESKLNAGLKAALLNATPSNTIVTMNEDGALLVLRDYGLAQIGVTKSGERYIVASPANSGLVTMMVEGLIHEEFNKTSDSYADMAGFVAAIVKKCGLGSVGEMDARWSYFINIIRGREPKKVGLTRDSLVGVLRQFGGAFLETLAAGIADYEDLNAAYENATIASIEAARKDREFNKEVGFWNPVANTNPAGKYFLDGHGDGQGKVTYFSNSGRKYIFGIYGELCFVEYPTDSTMSEVIEKSSDR